MAELAKEFLLVRKVDVDRGRRVFDPLCNLPHRYAFESLGDEEFPGSIEDLVSRFRLLAFASLFDSHNDGTLVNDVKLTTLSYCALFIVVKRISLIRL